MQGSAQGPFHDVFNFSAVFLGGNISRDDGLKGLGKNAEDIVERYERGQDPVFGDAQKPGHEDLESEIQTIKKIDHNKQGEASAHKDLVDPEQARTFLTIHVQPKKSANPPISEISQLPDLQSDLKTEVLQSGLINRFAVPAEKTSGMKAESECRSKESIRTCGIPVCRRIGLRPGPLPLGDGPH